MYRAFHKLPQIYTANQATFPIQMYAFTVKICGNFWGTQYIVHLHKPKLFRPMSMYTWDERSKVWNLSLTTDGCVKKFCFSWYFYFSSYFSYNYVQPCFILTYIQIYLYLKWILEQDLDSDFNQDPDLDVDLDVGLDLQDVQEAESIVWKLDKPLGHTVPWSWCQSPDHA